MRRTHPPPDCASDLTAAATASQAEGACAHGKQRNANTPEAIRILVRELARLSAKAAWDAAAEPHRNGAGEPTP